MSQHPITQTKTYSEICPEDTGIEITGLPLIELSQEEWELFAEQSARVDREAQILSLHYSKILSDRQKLFLIYNGLSLARISDGIYPDEVEADLLTFFEDWNSKLGLMWWWR